MLQKIDDFIWGIPLIVLILSVGIFLTIRLKGLQITKLPQAVKNIFKNDRFPFEPHWNKKNIQEGLKRYKILPQN